MDGLEGFIGQAGDRMGKLIGLTLWVLSVIMSTLSTARNFKKCIRRCTVCSGASIHQSCIRRYFGTKFFELVP